MRMARRYPTSCDGRGHRTRVNGRRPRWRITCSCGWIREASSAWTATAIARLHARYLTGPDPEHDTITIEAPRDPDLSPGPRSDRG